MLGHMSDMAQTLVLILGYIEKRVMAHVASDTRNTRHGTAKDVFCDLVKIQMMFGLSHAYSVFISQIDAITC